jgi:hypothetical protein
MGIGLPLKAISARLPESGSETSSSAKQFQPLQDGHLPSHFDDMYPQCWQKKLVFVFFKLFLPRCQLQEHKFLPNVNTNGRHLNQIIPFGRSSKKW